MWVKCYSISLYYVVEEFKDIKNESMEIKEEPIHGSANIKEEDPFTLPIADVSWTFTSLIVS